jgi:Protein of unknown function (DUF2934)
MKLKARSQKVRPASHGEGPETTRAGASAPSEAGSGNGIHARIASLAYQLYEQRGRVDGNHVEDWIQAEHTILAGKS